MQDGKLRRSSSEKNRKVNIKLQIYNSLVQSFLYGTSEKLSVIIGCIKQIENTCGLQRKKKKAVLLLLFFMATAEWELT